MSELNTAKPLIEDVIGGELNGEVLNNAINLVTYLKENKMNPLWSATNAWKISYKSFSVCFIRVHGAADYHSLEKGTWQIIPFIGEYDDSSLRSELREIVWANKKTCRACGRCCLELSQVFGKKYDYACEKSIVFTNPDAKSIECIKKLIELRKINIKEGKAKKHKYIPMKDRK